MKKDFYVPAKYKMSIPAGLANVAGGLIFPSGIQAPTLVRRDLSTKYPHLQNRLLDPQIYLSSIPAVTCRRACVNLSSYGWFLTKGIKRYDSAAQNQAQWKADAAAKIHNAWPGNPPTSDVDIRNSVLKCVAFQSGLDCAYVIIPTPLTADLGSNYGIELKWIDLGLEAIAHLASGSKSMATIALSDTCLRGIDPWRNDLLTVIVDQVTSRKPDGAYIVIEQANEHGYFCTHPNTIGSLLRLIFELKAGGISYIVLGPVGIAGLLGLAVGADGWSTGWYRSERRIKMTDYEDQIGMAVPTYYSHQLAGEIHLESDLDRLQEKGLFRAIEDETAASKGLIRAVRANRKVSSVPEWEHRKSNISAATEHFLQVAARETAFLSQKDAAASLNHAHNWLQKAESLASNLFSVGGFNPRTELNHQAAWLKAFENFLSATGRP